MVSRYEIGMPIHVFKCLKRFLILKALVVAFIKEKASPGTVKTSRRLVDSSRRHAVWNST